MCIKCIGYVVHYTGSSTEVQPFEMKSEADSNDVKDYSHDDKPTTGMSAFRCETLDHWV